MTFLVLNKGGDEGVVFENKKDALYASTGVIDNWSCSTLADAFRQTYAYDEPEKQFEMRKISIAA